MKKKSVIILFAIILVGIVSFNFIKSSNDHKECSTTVENEKDKKGNTVTITKHNCKEKYNF